MRWKINCLRCGNTWQIETQTMENGLPPARAVKCPNCQDETIMYKKFELLEEAPQKPAPAGTNPPTPAAVTPAAVKDKGARSNKMSFLDKLFGKKQTAPAPASAPAAAPAAAPASQATAVPHTNPFTIDTFLHDGAIMFICPACHQGMQVTQQQIDPVIGINIACKNCKSIAHVPGIYRTDPNPFGSWITGSVRMPIGSFPDWYFDHPMISRMIKSGDSDLLFDYGLWAFCTNCFHQFPATVLWSLAIAQRSGGFVFNARTPESARDFQALRAGHCPACQGTQLMVIAAEIPDYIRTVILSKRK